MKKILVLITTMSLLFGMHSFADFGVMPIGSVILDETELIINEEKIIFSDYAVEPYDKEDVKMLPLRVILESLGFDVKWNASDMSIDIDHNSEHIKIFIGQDMYMYNDVETLLVIAPEIIDSRTFVPYTFFEDLMDVTVLIEGDNIVVNGYVDYEFDLEEDQDFIDIVADVPENYLEDNFYEYQYDITISPLENMGSAIRIKGSNHSDDMFMGFYKKITGLDANQTYIYKLSFDIGTNVSGGMMGIGGSPGSSVYVKAGILSAAPISELDSMNHYRLTNLDKANQSQSGTDLKVVSDMEKTSDDYSEVFEYKTVVNHFIAKTNENGEVYILIGTDSGFEGLTTVYYDNIKLSVKEASDYNKSILQESNYELKYATQTLENKTVITVPEATNFVNEAKEKTLNLLIEEKVNDIVSKGDITSLRFSYTKKSNGLLSIVFNSIYKIEGGTLTIYDVLNVNSNNMTVITTEDLIKQDETSLLEFNTLFSEKLEQKGLNDTKINNGMTVFYEQGIYAVVYLAKDSDTRETMIMFNEDDVKDLMNY